MDRPSNEWLERMNAQLGAENVPHKTRPWEAWTRWGAESGHVLGLSDPEAKRIFAWFRENTKAGSQQVGPFYVGAFYYDAEFWPIELPIVFGTAVLKPLDWLPTMLDSLKTRLHNTEPYWTGYVETFADCLDVSLLAAKASQDSILPQFARQLLASGGDMLSAAAELLLLKHPNPKALQDARMATEMFLKAFLVAKDGLTEKQVKDEYSHNIAKAMKRALVLAPGSDFAQMEPELSVFPPIEERYESNKWPNGTLWKGYAVALRTAATVLRLLTGEDVRKQGQGTSRKKTGPSQ